MTKLLQMSLYFKSMYFIAVTGLSVHLSDVANLIFKLQSKQFTLLCVFTHHSLSFHTKSPFYLSLSQDLM